MKIRGRGGGGGTSFLKQLTTLGCDHFLRAPLRLFQTIATFCSCNSEKNNTK